jgi:O-antigen ligase
MPLLSSQFKREWLSSAGIFSAGLFCLFAAMFFGAKMIAAAQVFLIAAIILAIVEKGWSAFQWSELRPSARWLGVFVILSVLSILFNTKVIEGPLEYIGKLRYFVIAIAILALPVMTRANLGELWRRDALALAWLIPMVLSITIGVIGWVTGSHPLGIQVVDIRRVSGFYGQVMTFAYSLQFSVVALAIFFTMPALWRKLTRVPWWAMVVAALIAGGGLYLTYTRGAMLGVVTGFVIYAMMRSKKLLLLILAVGIVGGAVAYQDGSRYLKTESSIRVNQWKAAALSILERPVAGWGYRNFEPHSAELKERYGFEKDLVKIRGKKPQLLYFQSHAHNNYLEAFASTGVFGGIALLLFFYCWLREALRSRYAQLFVPLIGAFLVSGFFEDTFYDSEVLNCILLIYLATQWSLSEERDHSALAADSSGLDEGSGLITTDT